MKKGPNSGIKTPILTEEQKARFWSKVNISKDSNKCWEWAAGTYLGYGRVNINYKNHKANRIAFAISYDTVPAGKVVAHSCDNKLCVNPNHLFLTDQKGNMLDAISKNRWGAKIFKMPSGKNHWRQK